MANDEEEQDTRPVGFWHRDLNETRKYVVKKWIITSMFLLTWVFDLVVCVGVGGGCSIARL